MSVGTMKLAGRDFVVIPRREYERLRARSGKPTKAEEIEIQDKGDVAESRRRMAEPGKSIPLSELRKRYGK